MANVARNSPFIFEAVGYCQCTYFYTDVAEVVLSRCVETNERRMEESTEDIHPKYLVTYDYELLDGVIPHSSPAALSR